MAQLLVESTNKPIVISPERVGDEVAQNVRVIINTPKGTVPLDRDFGLDFTVLDRPMPVAKALMEVDIVDQVGTYEPRARVLEVKWLRDDALAMDGSVQCQVLIDVEGNA